MIKGEVYEKMAYEMMNDLMFTNIAWAREAGEY